eukprot:3077993-Prymnesium_polylepis.1
MVLQCITHTLPGAFLAHAERNGKKPRDLIGRFDPAFVYAPTTAALATQRPAHHSLSTSPARRPPGRSPAPSSRRPRAAAPPRRRTAA